ncbi:trimeric intracellular cation channel family protein [Sphingomonas sp. BGYR3]|uniref:trimeric intracellular cation channel family protein n=1 Tax=Sphingomonas sp. BGYR3 TaxID=2975483 RepID=UPI0021A349AB|nr:trimeric intracellular cation channel family protein [Sphingomonas sp. BGYR3]MDG5488232.1 trimeric intracellular cation channel family protein [Sphingomonas sp. BGYR3]
MTPLPLPLLSPLLPWFDGFGIAVFAATGALAAARARQTLVTACFFALITGVGGGTIRDLLIGAPVFWVHHPFIAAICLAAALLIWVTPEAWWRGQGFDWLDALGLAAYAVFGAAKALGYGVEPVPAFIMGVITACAGGIIRDVLAGEPSILMRPELYVTAAALAAGTHVGLSIAGLPVMAAAVPAALAGFGLRAAAIRWKLALPSYRGRRQDD